MNNRMKRQTMKPTQMQQIAIERYKKQLAIQNAKRLEQEIKKIVDGVEERVREMVYEEIQKYK